SKWVNGFVQANPRDFGEFYLAIDSVAPIVSTKNFQTGATIKSNALSFSVDDKIMGVDDYDAYIDNKWVLMEYDAKYKQFNINLDKLISIGEHAVKLVVSDSLNNKKTYNFKFKL
ncbi:MAG: M23 family peptidase, partial [Pseudomonadota bacterium]